MFRSNRRQIKRRDIFLWAWYFLTWFQEFEAEHDKIYIFTFAPLENCAAAQFDQSLPWDALWVAKDQRFFMYASKTDQSVRMRRLI